MHMANSGGKTILGAPSSTCCPRKTIKVHDNEDESDGKMVEVKGSPRCPVQTVDNYLRHLHPRINLSLPESQGHLSQIGSS